MCWSWCQLRWDSHSPGSLCIFHVTWWALLKILPGLSSLLFVTFCSTAVNDALVSWLSHGSDKSAANSIDKSAANSIQLQYPVVDHLQGANCSFDALREWARCTRVCVRVYACAYRRAHMHTTAGRKRTRVHRHTLTQRRIISHIRSIRTPGNAGLKPQKSTWRKSSALSALVLRPVLHIRVCM